MTPAALAARVRAGERVAVGRALSLVENAPELAVALLEALRHGPVTAARSIGITGAPGAGKSTLVNALLAAYLARNLRLGVLAVDPSSPFTGGAVLGDRTRMDGAAHDPRVFIRSLASRGHRGGLADCAGAMLQVLAAAGAERIFIETVGAGQSELAVAAIADCCVVVCAPGLGDEVQALKAGILEIADVLVVSKGELPLAQATEDDLREAVELRRGAATLPVVIRVCAARGEGIEPLVDAIEQRL